MNTSAWSTRSTRMSMTSRPATFQRLWREYHDSLRQMQPGLPRQWSRAPWPRRRRDATLRDRRVQRALQRAALHAQSAGRQEINGPAVLIAMFQEADLRALLPAGRRRHPLRRDQLRLAWRLQGWCGRRSAGARSARARPRPRTSTTTRKARATRTRRARRNFPGTRAQALRDPRRAGR